MASSGISEYPTNASAEFSAEREELDWLLTSGVLGRSGNLNRVLKYVCEEHFSGRAHLIKEYAIATEALGRRPDFDPQTDTIVRVTVHSLRKRLQEVYQEEGADRPMRLVLPAGRYSPSFVSTKPVVSHPAPTPEPAAPSSLEAGTDLVRAPMEGVIVSQRNSPSQVGRVQRWLLGAFAVSFAALATWAIRHEQQKLRPVESPLIAKGALPAPQSTIHALMGSGRQPYTDHSGNVWKTANYCQSGTNLVLPNQKIEGTNDAPLYLGGVRGIAHCMFPVPPGTYEMHLHFAETSDLAAATRVASVSINAGPAFGMDVVDDAGGDGIATSTVLTGLSPENDGSIHIDYISEVSPLNTVEILPAPSAKLLPVRLVAGLHPFVDSDHQTWTSDRYFSGGRYGIAPASAAHADLGLYASDRVGRFRYNIPVVPMKHYRVRLYFREPWFGKENGSSGGPGSRVFDLTCNGVMLLKNFDILAEAASAPVVKTFDHIQATAGGRIELAFVPVSNYAIVDAIEVTPEDE